MDETKLHSSQEIRERIKTLEDWMDNNPHDGARNFDAGQRQGLLDTVDYIAELESRLATANERARTLEMYSKHKSSCATFFTSSGVCSCGLDDALKQA